MTNTNNINFESYIIECTQENYFESYCTTSNYSSLEKCKHKHRKI